MIMNLWEQTQLLSKTWRTSKPFNATRNNSKVARPRDIYLQINNSRVLLLARQLPKTCKEAPWLNSKWFPLTVMWKVQTQSIYWITCLPNQALSTFKHQQLLISRLLLCRMGIFKCKTMDLKYLILRKRHNHRSHLGKFSTIMNKLGNQARQWYSSSRMRFYSLSSRNPNLKA